ncbi:hypothetical protein [Microcoleus sp.]|uniref:hypothetical protein n=1 Tax=Microcoleus sp. TaxID=44472 RepID=UPI003526ADD3
MNNSDVTGFDMNRLMTAFSELQLSLAKISFIFMTGSKMGTGRQKQSKQWFEQLITS